MKNKLFSTLLILTLIVSIHFICSAQEKEALIRNWVFPARGADVDSKLIDLTNYYTASLDDDWLVSAGADLQRFPEGVHTFDHVKFDVRGIIQLGGTGLYEASDYTPEGRKKHYPEKVNGIKIDQKASKINFLHATAWGETNGKEVGQYVINFEDGTSVTIPLKYMDAFRDWWFMPKDEMPKNASIAWTGFNDLTEKKGYQIRLFNYEWKNPSPGKTIRSIDFISTMSGASPFLLAITLGE